MLGLKMLKVKTISQDEFDKQLLPSTPNKELTFNGTHMAFVDPAPDPEYIFYAYKRYNYTQKILTSLLKKIFIKM